jgi:hypothetical protein
MHKFSIFIAFLFITIVGCNSKKEVPNTDIDVARSFIRNILNNQFKEAQPLLLPEETNTQYFNLFEKQYESKSKAELKAYQNAEIIINEIENLNDSVTIVNYSNSYKKANVSKVKVIKRNGKWLVDFKYTFSGNL